MSAIMEMLEEHQIEDDKQNKIYIEALELAKKQFEPLKTIYHQSTRKPIGFSRWDEWWVT